MTIRHGSSLVMALDLAKVCLRETRPHDSKAINKPQAGEEGVATARL